MTALAVEFIFIIDHGRLNDLRGAAHQTAACAAIGAIFVILLMPFRSPALPSTGIGVVGKVPTSATRSPEDNLRLWQFLSISWMAPLISIGRNRTLQEEDVWSLGFQFQHKRLHEKFRRLRGSVISRLLQANGIDIFILAMTACLEVFCG
jgi:hypothetical protein